MSWPVTEFEVDQSLVHSLLAEQHPDLARLPLTQIDAGWDNVLWRLGDELLVRLPRRRLAVPLTVNEQRWLPTLAPRLPLPVPAPIRMGRPTGEYPSSWTVVPWLPGAPGDRTALIDPRDAAKRLGRFLQALHHGAPSDAPHNPYRGVPLALRAESFEERVAALKGEIDVEATQRVWDRALAAESWANPQFGCTATFTRPTSFWIGGPLGPSSTSVTCVLAIRPPIWRRYGCCFLHQ